MGRVLSDRIQRGEAAIARAKELGRDVSHWEQHLERLKREAAEDTLGTAPRRANQPQPHSFENDADLPVSLGRITNDDVSRIMEMWGAIGVKQTQQRSTEHWEAIAKWLNTPPKTIRYMDKQQLVALRKEIIAALLAAPFGTTKEKAEKLTIHLLSVERLPWPPEPEPRNSDLLNEQPRRGERK